MPIYKRIITLCLLTILLFFNIQAVTFASDIMFYNITTENGLSQNTVKTIFQDSNGYIWIGTNSGLNKYNGFDFKLYTNNLNNNQNIVDGNITCLNEDLEKNLWIGTNDGLSKLNLTTNEITNYYSNNCSLSSNKIRDLKVDSKGNVIIATPKGIDIYNRNIDDFAPLFSKDLNYFNNNISIELYKDNYIYGISSNKFFKYDRLKNEYTIINTEILDNIPFQNIFTDICIYEDTIYLGTESNGLYTYDLKSNRLIKSYDLKNSTNNQTSSCISSILPDGNNIWIGTNNGLYLYNENGIQRHYSQSLFNKYSLVNDSVNCIFKDSSGLLWIGTFSGLSTVDYNQKISYYNTLSLNSSSDVNLILGIFEDNDDNLWISTYKSGILKINKKTDEKKYINTESENALSTNIIWDIKGNEKYIFAATEKGINIIDKNTLEVKVISDELNNPFTCSLYIDDNYLWAGTIGGFNIINLNDFSVKSLTPLLNKYDINVTLGGPIFKDSHGIYWLGTANKDGLIRLDPTDYSLKLFKYDGSKNNISDSTIISIAEDFNGDLWFGTESGLNKYNRENNSFTSYFMSDGLSNNTICSIIPYGNNQLWISTKSGIDYLQFEKDKITNIKKYMTGTGFNYKSFSNTKNNAFYFGAINGLYILNPETINNDTYTPILKFDLIKANNQDLTNSKNFSVNYKEHSIYVKLFTNIYSNAENINFYYRMNENDDWILLDKNSILFSNLAANNYNIQFKAKNLNGIDSNIETLSFTVNPPFWRSSLAQVIYFIILIILIIYFSLKIHYMTNAIIIKDNQLDLEMKEKNKILKQNIKLEKRKNNYLINMSHELRTPLNILSSIQQLILNLNKKGPIPATELDKYMTMSGNNIDRLLKIINDLVDSSNIDEGRYKLFVEEKDIVYVIEECVLSFTKLSEEKEINLIFDTYIEECIMKFDQSAIERCISNLVGNALKFTEPGGEVLVNISTLNEYLKIDVIDNGIGISKENLNTIFDRFSQSINSDRETLSGSGLGLTITKRLIELHKGKIYAQSRINKGSIFTILLPINNPIL